MAKYPDLYVLRHGQTEWNLEGRYQGRGDSPLTQQGLDHALAQGRILLREKLDLQATSFFTSPQGRSQKTAKLALDQLGCEALLDERLVETEFGLWSGLSNEEIDANWPGNREVDNDFVWNFTAPGAETLDDMCDRCGSFLEDLTQPTVIVTHGVTSRVLRGLWLGLDSDGMAALRGGQGIVFHLSQGAQKVLEDNAS